MAVFIPRAVYTKSLLTNYARNIVLVKSQAMNTLCADRAKIVRTWNYRKSHFSDVSRIILIIKNEGYSEK